MKCSLASFSLTSRTRASLGEREEGGKEGERKERSGHKETNGRRRRREKQREKGEEEVRVRGKGHRHLNIIKHP